MKVVASDAVVTRLAEDGGRLFVWPVSSRCCGGLTRLRSSTARPANRTFRRIEAERRFEPSCPSTGRLPTSVLDVPGGGSTPGTAAPGSSDEGQSTTTGSTRRRRGPARQAEAEHDANERCGRTDREGGLQVDGVGDGAEDDGRKSADAHREPTDRPDAMPDVPRQVELAQHQRHPEGADDARPMSISATAPAAPPDVDEHEHQRRDQYLGDHERPPQPDSVGDRPERACRAPASSMRKRVGCRTPSSARARRRRGERTRGANHATERSAITAPSAIALRSSSPAARARRRVRRANPREPKRSRRRPPPDHREQPPPVRSPRRAGR